MASMYAVYHGPNGIRQIAARIHTLAEVLEDNLQDLGYKLTNKYYFDTLSFEVDKKRQASIKKIALAEGVNFHYTSNTIQVSLDETVGMDDLDQIIRIFAKAKRKSFKAMVVQPRDMNFPMKLIRETEYMTHPIFNKYHTESEMMRYIKRLENKDLSLMHSMISLGSCTMKLNAATELIPVSWAEFANIHPFAPTAQTKGYQKIFTELEAWLSEVTGFAACSLQPNSGAQGEYAGLLTIKAYHEANGNFHRNIALIPSSAHGTNPASAVMTGMKVVVVACDERGNIDVDDLKAKAKEHKDNLAALMVTYPSTHGVFEAKIKDICRTVHKYGGKVYMDGANMNAQVGLTSPGIIGADVCHLNLHKTFAIPHGGGGPGMGPICVNESLAPFLPKHKLIKTGGKKGIHAVSSAPWGSASILLISYAYIKMLGKDGLTDSTKYAILNANYIKARLEGAYSVLYKGHKGHAAHELIIDLRHLKALELGAEDVAKRLIDYGFHAPTMSWPVAGTLMIEPTESESKGELDKFCDAMILIHGEIQQVIDGVADKEDNVLKNAPHTAQMVISDEWNHSYSREQAAYPMPSLRNHKFWPSVGRIDNVHGDRNLVCSCVGMEAYSE